MVRQLGNDRIVQLQFGSGDAAYHVILELYDRVSSLIVLYIYLLFYSLITYIECRVFPWSLHALRIIHLHLDVSADVG